jgi:hypothetical protein
VVEERDGYKMVQNHVTRAKEWQETGATSAAVTCDRARVVRDYACDGDFDLLTSVRSQSNDILYRERRSHALQAAHTIVPMLLPDRPSSPDHPSG